MGVGAALIAAGCKDKGTNPMSTPPPSDTFESGTLGATPFTHTFNTAGSFSYKCRFHASSGMVGTVVVDASAANMNAAVNVGQVGNSFNPATVNIKPGGTVTWTLVNGTHTVTRP